MRSITFSGNRLLDIVGMSFKITVLLFPLLALNGCDSLPFGYTPIGDIVSDPGRFEEQIVKVRGEVTETTKIPLLEIKSYTLRDDSGEIVVYALEALPPLNRKAIVKARVKTVAIVDGKGIGLRLVQVE
jgi:hypothetical protein